MYAEKYPVRHPAARRRRPSRIRRYLLRVWDVLIMAGLWLCLLLLLVITSGGYGLLIHFVRMLP